ncbi:hypothetical protein D3C81_596520 [compost metagenome]
MLKWPKYDLPFEPTISYWLGGISTFDREETLGEELRKYNPNNSSDRDVIIRKYVVARFDDLPYRHKFVLFKILENYLLKPEFDFSTQFETDYETNDSVAWDETEVENPRGFFEDIFRLAAEEWKDELDRAGTEDQSTW